MLDKPYPIKPIELEHTLIYSADLLNREKYYVGTVTIFDTNNRKFKQEYIQTTELVQLEIQALIKVIYFAMDMDYKKLKVFTDSTIADILKLNCINEWSSNNFFDIEDKEIRRQLKLLDDLLVTSNMDLEVIGIKKYNNTALLLLHNINAKMIVLAFKHLGKYKAIIDKEPIIDKEINSLSEFVLSKPISITQDTITID